MSKPRLRLLLVAGVAILLAGAGYHVLRRDRSGASPDYVTAAVDRGAISAVVTATGTVNPVTTVQVGTYVSGPIRELFVDYNSPVHKGQLVAKIDPAPFQVKVQVAAAALANARAKVEKSRADLTLKKLGYERSRELRAQDLISQNELDTAKSNYEQAVAQLDLDAAGVKQAEASLQEARINLGYTDITSPVDGVVVSRNVDVGQTVAATFQTPTLFLIAQDLTRMQVDASVSESAIGDVRDGQPATFTVDAYPGRTFHGSVAQVRNAPITVQNVVTYDVVISVANPDLALKPGMTASVTITTAQREDVLRVPLRALRFRPEGAAATRPGPTSPATPDTGVWVLEPGGELRRVPVRLGLRDDQHAELLGGDLGDGDALAVAYRRSAESDSEGPRLPFQPRRPR
jgi:HlyD family secretion protein